jgi:hypothetical protein
MTSARPHRRRRVASDEAHAWARNLRLGNPYAKSVLRAVALYTNDEGICIAGLSTLGEDSDLSEDTVRKRLKFLEEIGAIARFAQWLDDRGRRNSEGRGKRTTDEIRLLLDADIDMIEARARGETAADDDPDAGEISPSQQQGLNPEPANRSPALAVGQPSHSREDLISEPEPESSPHPPSGGECDHTDQGESEPEHFAQFWAGYPGYRVMDRARALQVFSALTVTERALARAAVALLTEDLTKLKRRPKDAYKWLRDRGFDQYPNARLPEKPRDPVWISEAETTALAVVYRMLDVAPPRLVDDPARGRGVWRTLPIEPDLAAMGGFAEEDITDWPMVSADSKAFNAWRHRLHDWTGLWAEPRKRWLEPFDPLVHGLSPTHPDFKMRRAEHGLPVPVPWPPRKDGTLSPDTPSPTMTPDDIEAFAKEGTR